MVVVVVVVVVMMDRGSTNVHFSQWRKDQSSLHFLVVRDQLVVVELHRSWCTEDTGLLMQP